MRNLPRVTGKVFASNADANDIGQYGSALAGNKLLTSDISTIQGLPAYETGWRAAVLSTRNYPTLQEMNGLQKTFSQQICYLLQKGVADWDAGTEYFQNDFCKINNILYYSLIDNNVGHQPNPNDTSTYWAIYSGMVIDDYANYDLSNLTDIGNSKFQYMPFSINNGTLDANGENDTLTTAGGTPSTITVDKDTIPVLTSNVSEYGTANDYKLTGNSSSVGGYQNCTNPFTMTLAQNNHIGAGATVTFTISTRNVGYNYQQGNYYYAMGITGCKVTYTYADNTTADALDENGTGNFAGWTFATNAHSATITLASPTKEVVAISVTGYASFGKQYNYVNFWGVTVHAKWTESISSADTLICNPCTITTADSKSKTFTGGETLGCSTASDGTYKVFKSYTDGSLSLASSLPIQKIAPTSPNADDLWLDNSQFPLAFKKYVAQNYTIVGTDVTVSDDGIASGFSSTSGIDTIKLLPNTSSWEVKLRYIYKTSTNNYDYLIYNSAGDTGIAITVTSAGVTLTIQPESGSSVVINTADGTQPFADNDIVDISSRYDSTEQKYYLTVFKNGNTFLTGESATTTTIIKQTNTGYMRLGFRAGVNRYVRGSIDLSKFEVYINGALTYKPAIPNGWVKNDSVYIGDVTVSSGLITDINNRYFNACPALRYVVDTYQNGASGYAIYSDGWCEQWGSCTSGTAVVLANAYKDTNYTLSVTYSTKSATGFTPSATGDYIAKGFIE